MKPSIPRALTIAGSDSGGGAGIQADLKTFQALGVYGMSAIAAVTVQNTQGVFGVHELPPDIVAAQINVVAEDIGVDAAKTGMLSNAAIIQAVAESIRRNRIERLVVDPVMVAKSGDALLHTSAQDAMRDVMLPLALVVTPNVPEVEALTGLTIRCLEDIETAARALHALGPRYVLIKGGHLDMPAADDYLFDGERVHVYSGPRLDTRNTHGTGCTYASAIAAFLARGLDVCGAVRNAKAYIARAIEASLPLGKGHGPLHHGWTVTPPEEL